MKYLGLFLICTFFLIAACKNTASEPKLVQPDHTIINPANSETLALLQGRWKNVSDPKNTMVIEGNSKKEEYEGMEVTNLSYFELDNRCINLNMPDQTPETDRYIIIENVCLYIKEISEENLVIANAESGNFLVYQRVK
ncbi:hypothetical protein [Portibacter lacus]|uniref:Lipocalin-like domain-containing protein n=1 Tax=Portibacter lacus TaxID=1099794 RepID=A0AA37WG07_9BACT|nr:hypothetical protein [Portibacter lacus]GLR19288.1 hypothetical protein GCM10007940_39040 [Portibacter lacus]